MRGLLFAMSFPAVLGLCCEAVAGFQPPLTAVQAWLTTNGYAVSVHYRVYDSDLAAWKESQRRYDGNSLAYWIVQRLTAQDGVVAWQAVSFGQFSSYNTEAGFATYDPARAAWLEGARVFPGDAALSWVISGLTTAGGVVMWQVSPTGPFAQPTTEIHYATYDPSRGAWMPGVHRYAGTAVSYWTVSKLALANGTVAWQAAAGGQFSSPDIELGSAIYDPVRGAWIEAVRHYAGTTFDSWTVSSLTLADGIVAWRAELSGQSSSRVSEMAYTLYDPSRGSWMTGSQRYEGNTVDHWTVTNFTVSNQRVQWTALHGSQSINEVRGYDQASGLWYAGPNKAFAWFQPSVLSGDAPLRVWLGDLSIGGSTWSWDFGDGVTNTQRNPYHVFAEPAVFTITELVSGPSGTNSTRRDVTVYGQGPPRFEAAGAQLTNGEFHVRLNGLTGRGLVVIWASAGLQNWQAILTNAPMPGSIDFIDVIGTNSPARFYRAVEQR